jgi:hypothetical protein
VMYIHREAEALLSFKKASYDAPTERNETPRRSFQGWKQPPLKQIGD